VEMVRTPSGDVADTTKPGDYGFKAVKPLEAGKTQHTLTAQTLDSTGVVKYSVNFAVKM
jgi:hypothetical protein